MKGKQAALYPGKSQNYLQPVWHLQQYLNCYLVTNSSRLFTSWYPECSRLVTSWYLECFRLVTGTFCTSILYLECPRLGTEHTLYPYLVSRLQSVTDLWWRQTRRPECACLCAVLHTPRQSGSPVGAAPDQTRKKTHQRCESCWTYVKS